MTEAAGRADGARILVVEDEALVAINLESILEDLGYRVVGPVMRMDRLVAIVEAGIDADAAILDVNIAGAEVFPQAERIARSGIPILFATGYGRAGLPAAWKDWPVIQKPYTPAEIRDAVRRVLGG